MFPFQKLPHPFQFPVSRRNGRVTKKNSPRRRYRNPLYLEMLEQREMPSIYYVAPNGNDSNSGTAASPFATLQNAMMSLQPGDILNVEPGSYAGFIVGWDSQAADTGDPYGTINGTATAPITIQADPSAAVGSVLINYQNAETQAGIDLEPGCNYITLNGFTINGASGGFAEFPNKGEGIKVAGSNNVIVENMTVENVNYGFGIIADNANNVVIKNCTITGTGYAQNDNGDYGHGIYLSGTNSGAVIEGNTICNNAYIGIHINGDAGEGGVGLVTDALIENNLIYDNGQNGINGDGLQSSTIENNLIYNYSDYGICLFQSDAGGPSIDNLIVNNTIVGTSTTNDGAIRILDGGTGNTILNNILLDGSGNTYRISSDSLSGLVSNYNVVSANVQSDDTGSEETFAQWQTQTGQDANSLTATASQLFVNAAANNYQLSATSPAVSAGTSLDAPSTDILGNPRPPGSIDIGCYQLPELPISPGSLPAGEVGVAYSQKFTASGGTGTITFSESDGLPAGLTFTAGTGTLSGTPTASGTFNFTVTATDSAGDFSVQAYTLFIIPAPSISPGSLPAGTVGVAYSQQFTASGGTGTITLSESGSLPAGLTFTASTGILSGTPTASGFFNFSMTATDSLGATSTQNYTLPINTALSSGIKWVQSASMGVLGINDDGTSQATGAFANNPTNGNYIVVWCWGWNSNADWTPSEITCSDNLATPNTYTQVGFVQSGCYVFSFFYTKITSTGSGYTPIITVNTVGASGISVAASEFSGIASCNPIEGTAVTAIGTGNSSNSWKYDDHPWRLGACRFILV